MPNCNEQAEYVIVQDVLGGGGASTTENVTCHRTRVGISQQREETRKREGECKFNPYSFLGWISHQSAVKIAVIYIEVGYTCLAVYSCLGHILFEVV